MMNKKIYDVAIVGGGSAGLMCAVKIKALHKKLRVCVIDRNHNLGKKLKMTGNGKCNLSNLNVSADNYITGDADFLNTVLTRKGVQDVIKSFECMGLICKSDSMGRVYPYSEQSLSVLNAFRCELDRLNVDIITDFDVEDIKKEAGLFYIMSQEDIILSGKLVLACGGMAYPKTGSDGVLLKSCSSLKLKIVKPYPVLVPVKILEEHIVSLLQGVRIKARVSLFCTDEKICDEVGEVQFRKDSISGICVFDLSKYVSEYFTLNTINRKNSTGRLRLSCDFFYDMSYEKLLSVIKRRLKQCEKNTLEEILSLLVNKKAASALIRYCGLKRGIKAEDLSFSDIQKITASLKDFSLTPTGTLSFKEAQASSGGLDCSEISASDMMLIKLKNLYAIGEVLDVAGNCGGYNLHFAWVTAMICAENI